MEFRMTAMGKPKSAEETMERDAVFITASGAESARHKFLARFPDAVGITLHFWNGEANGSWYANGIKYDSRSKRPGAKRSMGEVHWCLPGKQPWSRLEWKRRTADEAAP